MNARLVSLFSILALLLWCGPLAHIALAQTSSGVISGRIVDSQGSSVPDAPVVLTQDLTGVKLTSKTDASGDFVFPSVLPGRYSVGIQVAGFKRLEKQDLVLAASERLSAGTIALEVGGVSESVTVTSEATPIQTSSLERSAVLNDKQMGLLSTPGRDYMNMLKVLPGVAYQDGNGSSTLGAVGVPIINGGRNDYTSVNVDGVVGNSRGLGTTENEMNLDAVAEVKVLMGNYQAEYGKNSGAVVNVVTKGGTRQFHGGAYWYKRHEMFNANSYFNNKQSVAKSRYRYNTVGYNLGGPVFIPGKLNRNKDKLFFFFSQEWQPNTRSGGTRTWTMPSDLERKGDFSQSLQSNGSLIVIKDPTNATAFPGNAIPANRINADMQKLLGVFPLPNFTNRAVSKGNYNYILSDTIDNPIRQEILRIDYSPTEKWRTYFRGMNMYVNNNGTASTANTNSWGIVQAYNTTNPNIAGNVTYMASPTLVNEFSVGLARWTEDQLIAGSELAKLQRDKLGIKLGQLYPANNPLNVIPGASFG
ncbi:MAG: carboxypeptidase regulatory-like domain-containing protein, partial [Candidatus Solibacter sp.]|nr:carboxypeptidase regulatory-like domain-containing protein [Candidatus Solibacter sp.]